MGYAAIAAAFERTWKEFPLEDYRQPIPEFVLQTALDVKSCPELANTKLMIDVLGERNANMDPFLVLVTKDTWQRFYLEVWNEPGYKHRRHV